MWWSCHLELSVVYTGQVYVCTLQKAVNGFLLTWLLLLLAGDPAQRAKWRHCDAWRLREGPAARTGEWLLHVCDNLRHQQLFGVAIDCGVAAACHARHQLRMVVVAQLSAGAAATAGAAAQRKHAAMAEIRTGRRHTQVTWQALSVFSRRTWSCARQRFVARRAHISFNGHAGGRFQHRCM